MLKITWEVYKQNVKIFNLNIYIFFNIFFSTLQFCSRRLPTGTGTRPSRVSSPSSSACAWPSWCWQCGRKPCPPSPSPSRSGWSSTSLRLSSCSPSRRFCPVSRSLFEKGGFFSFFLEKKYVTIFLRNGKYLADLHLTVFFFSILKWK